MKNMPKCISYAVWILEMVRLFLRNTGNVKHIAELHFAKHQQVHGILRETRFFPRLSAELEKKNA
jgi:hypothetical protein